MVSTRNLIAAVVYSTVFAYASPSKLTLFHRVFHPTASQATFLERGTVTISENSHVTFQPAPSLSQDLLTFSESLQGLDYHASRALYQIALQRDGDIHESQWDISSVKICHLPKVTSETIVLHTSGDQNSKPFAIDYFTSPVPHGGLCPKPKSKKSSQAAGTLHSSLSQFANNFHTLNTTILLRESSTPPLPELIKPPPLTQDGEIVQPVPEKSFLQKYWIYIVGLLVVLLVSSGPEDEQPKKGGQ